MLKGRHLAQTQWEEILPEALHSVRTLLCTSINTTPHERLFQFPRRSTLGRSLPSWLVLPGPVLLKKFVRNKQDDPFCEEVELIEANPNSALLRFSDGRETTVSTSDLAPTHTHEDLTSANANDILENVSDSLPSEEPPQLELTSDEKTENGLSCDPTPSEPLRRLSRTRRRPDRYGENVYN